MKLIQHLHVSAAAILGFMLCVSTLPVRADIRISKRGTTTIPNSNRASWTRTIEIKGLKMRLESGQGMSSRVTIYDLESGKRFRFSPSSKEVFELDLKPVSKRWKERIIQSKIQRVIRPSGAKYEVLGLGCDEYAFDFQAPISVDGYAPKQIAHDSGTVCLSQNIAAGAEFANFVHEAGRRGYVVAVAVLSPTFSPIGSYFFGEEPNFIVLSGVTKCGYDSLPGAQNPSSAVEDTWTVTEIRSESIPDEDFRIPHDWNLRRDQEFDMAALSQPTPRSRTLVRKVSTR